METLGIALLGLALAAMAAWAGLRPNALLAWVEEFWRGGERATLIAGLRFAAGGYLIWVAHATPWPSVTIGLGILLLVAGFAVLLLSRARIDDLFEWWRARPSAVRSMSIVWSALAALFLYLGLAPA